MDVAGLALSFATRVPVSPPGGYGAAVPEAQ